MKKTTKKGFTIVELVVVIAIIAILAAVLIPTFSSLIKRANVSKDQQLVRNLNTALIADKAINGKHATMTAALNAVKESGFDVATINSKKASDNEILWDSENDIFCYLNDGTIEYLPENKGTDFKELVASSSAYWCVVNATKKTVSGRDGKNWSVYLASSAKSEITVSTGVDVGNCDNITSVIYENTTDATQNVVIRTNSANTTLTINAEHDTVNHYGNVGKVDAQKIDMNCYNEYGTAAYVKVTEGKVVAKAGGKIEVVFANNTDSTKVAVAKESTGTIERGLTTVQVVDENNFANYAVHLEYSADGETPYTADAIETIAQEAINTAVENTEFKGVAIVKAGEATQLMTLDAFRNSVNAGNTYAGYTVKLLDDIDLNNVKWTPIGTNEHPFSGIFDGQNHVISNFIVSIETRDAGLFGVVRGVHTASMEADYTRFWDETTSNLKFGSDSESHFETIIKNLTLKNVDVSTTQNYAGGLAGYTIDTYVGNVYVESGSTYATTGKVGGVIGSSNGFTVLNNLTTGKNLTVTGDNHTIGGIVANIQRGYSNGDHVKIYQDATSAPTHAVLVENCTNNATVVWDKNGTYAGGVPIAGVIGNSGSTSEPLTVVVYKCTNNGAVQAGKCSYASGIIGQSHTLVKVVYGCVNNGNITADAYYELSSSDQGGVAGITITGYASLIACSNTGTLINNHENGNVYDITSAYRNIIIEASNFESVAALQSEINSRNNDSCRAVVLKNITVTDIAGMLTLPTNIESIKANTKVCESVDLSGNLTNINMVGLNQKVAVTRTIIFSGSNCEIEVEENKVAGNIHLQGDNLSLTNNGTMGTLTYGVYGQEGTFTATNNGTMTGVGSVTGSSNMTLINNGTISREDWHTFDIETDGSLIVHNYGTIHGKNGNPYALLLYGGCDVTFYAHSGSIVEGGLAAYSKAHTVIIYADAGTTINGNPWSSVSSKTYNVTVNQ